MSKVTVAATQMACTWDRGANTDKAEKLVREAAEKGAQIIQLQELFETQYFAQIEDFKYLDLARSRDNNEMIMRMQALARELRVVLPVSFFEDAGMVRFNTTAIIDADGEVLGIYRKTHIPDDMGYYEKFYFSPGNTGFRVWDTKYARIGAGICWDQWFPEAARIMSLKGAQFLFYPTAIGSFALPVEKIETYEEDEKGIIHWQNTMLGHAAANMAPVIASNRIGIEEEPKAGTAIRFWGSSFISDNTGVKVAEMDDRTEGCITAEFDMDELEEYRKEVCLFRDRRPSMYSDILTLEGKPVE